MARHFADGGGRGAVTGNGEVLAICPVVVLIERLWWFA